MPAHDLSTPDATTWLAGLARRALEHYDVEPGATLALLNISENATYAVDEPGSRRPGPAGVWPARSNGRSSPATGPSPPVTGPSPPVTGPSPPVTGRRTVLRLHRRGYHDRTEISSELAWLDALREQAGVRTPRVIADRTGQRLVALAEDGQAEPRYAVLFEWLPGTQPHWHTLAASFEELGEITARMHEHVLSWRRPPGFTRFAWDYEGAFGSVARWGRWQDGIAVGGAEREVLGRLDRVLRTRLARYGRDPHRYGLVHADLRLANLLVDRDSTYVIDFDDCGWSWYLYDLGAALSFIEHDPRVPELVDAWTRGYRTIRPLSTEDEDEIPTFIMMRRLLLVAWIGSHSGTDLARTMGAQYTRDSCELAERYLDSFG